MVPEVAGGRPVAGGGTGHAPQRDFAGDAHLGGRSVVRRPIKGGGVHLVLGPGRGFSTGGLRGADRVAEGGEQVCAARGPKRPPTGCDVEDILCADPQFGID